VTFRVNPNVVVMRKTTASAKNQTLVMQPVTTVLTANLAQFYNKNVNVFRAMRYNNLL
jgi:hypothetical protein